MPQTFRIDQAATFAGVVLLSVEPKVGYGSAEQDRTSGGVLKWEAQIVAGFRQFGRTVNEVLKIGLVSDRDPGEGLNPYTPIQLVGFEVGVMAKERRNRETGASEVVGVQVWYRAEEIRAISATGPGRSLRPVAEGAS